MNFASALNHSLQWALDSALLLAVGSNSLVLDRPLPLDTCAMTAYSCTRTLSELDSAYGKCWGPIWNRHVVTDVERWAEFMQLAQEQLPVHPLVLKPISVSEWRRNLQETRHSMRGTDTSSLNDLLHFPDPVAESTVSLFNDVEFNKGSPGHNNFRLD